jgi:hypothetical protein
MTSPNRPQFEHGQLWYEKGSVRISLEHILSDVIDNDNETAIKSQGSMCGRKIENVRVGLTVGLLEQLGAVALVKTAVVVVVGPYNYSHNTKSIHYNNPLQRQESFRQSVN